MLFKRFYDDGLAQASYLIGCAATGQALVVDPNRAVEQYLAAAGMESLRITHVTETHIHADFVSGLRELASRTGAEMYLSDMGPIEWKYGFSGAPSVTLLRDGDTFRVGNILIKAIHTPGHTPEHLAFIVTDTAGATEPMGVVTGDFVFVGDVGRPDLLEKAAHMASESTGAARDLFRSLQAFKQLPDHLQIWPGHGAGSACGKGMSAVPQSTIGYEWRFNWAFEIDDEEDFVRRVLGGQTEPPAYFGRMKLINRDGPSVLGSWVEPAMIADHRLEESLQETTVVDMRPAATFAAGFVPGAINIPWNRSFVTYAGSLVSYERDVVLLAPDPDGVAARKAARALMLIGLDRVRGYVSPTAVRTWGTARGPLHTIPQVSVLEFSGGDRAGVTLVDVRGLAEWEQGHLEAALHIPLPELPDRLDEIPTGGSVVLHCQSGGRSAVAASLLAARGHPVVQNMTGGYGAWIAAGLPIATPRRM